MFYHRDPDQERKKNRFLIFKKFHLDKYHYQLKKLDVVRKNDKNKNKVFFNEFSKSVTIHP